MDKVVYIDDGCIKAVGTHDELVASCPEYNTMVELQRLDDMEAAHDQPVEEVTANA